MKVLIFYAPFGGGHLSCAQAIKISLLENNPNLDVKILDATAGSGFFGNFSIKAYRLAAGSLNTLWSTFYYWTKFSLPLQFMNWVLNKSLSKNLKNVISIEKPDFVVTTYFAGDVLDKVVKSLDLDITIKTLIADPFTFHPVWLINKNQEIAVMSSEAYETAMKRGYPRENIHLINPITKSEFLVPHSKTRVEEIKSELNLTRPKTILIIGGGEGLKNSSKILNELISSKVDANIITVCGRNQSAEKKALQIKSKHPENSITVFGFSDRVVDLMNVADIIITKAGPGVIFEAAFLKKPILLTSYLWEQELGNKEFVVNNKIGYFEPNIRRIPFFIRGITEATYPSWEISESYKKLNLQSGNSQIVDFVLNTVKIDDELYF